MAYFDDLSECSYFEDPRFPRLIAVGWLENGRSFVTGDPGSEVRRRLDEFREANWHLTAYFGGHECDLCTTHDDLTHWSVRDTYFKTDLFIPGPGVLYGTPEGICHYAKKHAYRPPDAFCEALLAAPLADSSEYFEALHELGIPRQWLRRVGTTG